jgi:hypothetical protein
LRVAAVASNRLEGSEEPDTVWLNTHIESTTQCSSTWFLAEWIGENMREEQGFPDKWSVAEQHLQACD